MLKDTTNLKIDRISGSAMETLLPCLDSVESMTILGSEFKSVKNFPMVRNLIILGRIDPKLSKELFEYLNPVLRSVNVICAENPLSSLMPLKNLTSLEIDVDPDMGDFLKQNEGLTEMKIRIENEEGPLWQIVQAKNLKVLTILNRSELPIKVSSTTPMIFFPTLESFTYSSSSSPEHEDNFLERGMIYWFRPGRLKKLQILTETAPSTVISSISKLDNLEELLLGVIKESVWRSCAPLIEWGTLKTLIVILEQEEGSDPALVENSFDHLRRISPGISVKWCYLRYKEKGDFGRYSRDMERESVLVTLQMGKLRKFD